MPIIKLTAIKDGKLGSKAAKFVHGEKVDSGEEWSKGFFANDKTLKDQIEDFEVGDYVNVVMVQKGEYWNIKEFQEASAEMVDKAKRSNFRPGFKDSPSARRNDGGSRGDDTNRSAAIYLAREIVQHKLDNDGGPGTMSPVEVAVLCVDLAHNIIYPYIKDGVVPVVEKPKRKKADPLEPPEIN
jgi:hypothetical protein